MMNQFTPVTSIKTKPSLSIHKDMEGRKMKGKDTRNNKSLMTTASMSESKSQFQQQGHRCCCYVEQ